MSYHVSGLNWVYDITLVHNFKNLENSSIFNTVKNQLYSKDPSKDHFLKLIDNKLINKYELEIEYKPEQSETGPGTINLKELEMRLPSLVEYNNYILVINQISTLLGRDFRSFKSMLPQAVTLTAVSYNTIYPPVDWYLTHKTDGYRGIAYIKNNMIIVICAKYFKIYYCRDKVCKPRKELLPSSKESETDNHEKVLGSLAEEEKKDSLFVVDCEIVDNNLYIFDIIVYESINVSSENFDRRYGLLEKLSLVLETYKSELNIQVKYFRKISDDLQRSFKDVIDYKPDYPHDGYMLINSTQNYMQTRSYKIKTQNTIDFYLFKCPAEFLNKFNFVQKKGLTLYILYLTYNKSDLIKNKIKPLPLTLKSFKNAGQSIPIHFSPNDYPDAYLYYSKVDLGIYTIAEMDPIFNEDEEGNKTNFDRWDLIKIRDDKLLEPNYYGNYYTMGEEMWYANQNPLNIVKMYLPSSSYFMVQKSNIYFAQTAFNSFVKETLIKSNNNTQDCMRFSKW